MYIFVFIYLSLSYGFNSFASSDDEKTKSLIEFVTNKVDQCFDDLGEELTQKCVNLDSQKRKELAVSIMICELAHDDRLNQLNLNVNYTNIDDFISHLKDDNFRVFTTYFTCIDSLCFHYAHEQLSTNNLQKILNVYKAVTLSTEFLIAARDNLDQTTKTIRTKLVDVQEQIYTQATSISNMTEIIKSTTEKLKEITNQASAYKNSISNAKYYLTVIGISILASFVFTNVFMPVLFVTGVFLFIEVNVKSKYYLTGKAFKYCYAAICILIFLLSVWDQIGLIKVKFNAVFKKKPSRKLPRICN